MTPEQALQKAIEQAGGVSKLARKLDVSKQAVSAWKIAPTKQALKIEIATGVSRKLLRPDLYPDTDEVKIDPQKPDLNAMVDHAGEFARKLLVDEKHKELMTVFLFLTGGGEIGIIGTPLFRGVDKDDIATVARDIMRERGAVAYSFLSEAWMKAQPPDKPMPNSIADDPDRMEVVVALAHDAHFNHRSKMWRMIRDKNGAVIDLQLLESHTDMMTSGRFSDLLLARA